MTDIWLSNVALSNPLSVFNKETKVTMGNKLFFSYTFSTTSSVSLYSQVYQYYDNYRSLIYFKHGKDFSIRFTQVCAKLSP